MSSGYSSSRTFHEESRRGNGGYGGYGTPYTSQVTVPIQQSTSSFNSSLNEQRLQDRLRNQETTVQWVNDPISGQEKFRVTIDINGFDQNEVNMRVEGNRLVVYGEHLENKNQNTAKKSIEKTYDLPRDIDTFSPRVTFPTPITMQIDFPSRHSNVIVDDGRTSSKYLSNYDTSYRTSPRFSREKTSSEYTSTRRLGGGGGGSGGTSTYGQGSSPRIYSTYDDINTGRNNIYSSTSRYSPTYRYNVTTDDIPSRIIYPSTTTGNNGNVYEKKFSETHRESHHRRLSPTTGVQSSHEVEHQRSGSPSLSRSLDEDRFRTNLTIGGINSSIIPPASSRNVEVREYSRRFGDNLNDNNTYNYNYQPLLLPSSFNSDAFYRSAFQPRIFADERGQNRIEMKLDIQKYQPEEIKVYVNGNDLIVEAEHNVNRPPTTSSRAYFYKQTTLPPNTDLSSLSSQYYSDGKLYITAKLSNAQPSIRYN
ncbi:unnamed protein product [Rotaria sp. Silwood1]|nr:unnamed protein product [Rotaria sp. Silwood1]CAF4567462.1 unnamed protein product [Rotaria sp. Silwood1]